MRRLIAILGLLFAAALPLSATTYYVSTAGSDSNTGLSKSVPFAHLPGMATWTGSYVPAAGDTIIVRGCDTWNNANFPIQWTWSGSAGNLITVTVDKTWYNTSACPSGWNRPIFNANGASVDRASCAGTIGNVILKNSGNYNWFAWIEQTQFYWDNSLCGGGAGVIEPLGAKQTYDNWYIHDWSHSSGTQDLQGLVATPGASSYCDQNTTTSCTFQYGVIDDCDGSNDSGGGVQSLNTINSIFQCMVNAIKPYTNEEIAGNYIARIAEHNFTGTHPNCLNIVGVSGTGAYYIHDNFFNEVSGGGCESGAMGNSGETDYVWNNVWVMAGVGADGPIIPNQQPTTWNFYFWNNTVVWPAGCTLEGGHGQDIVNYLFQNNHCINNGGFTNEDHNLLVVSGTDTESNNLAMSTATATSQGYTSGNNYAPTSATNSTAGAGTNMYQTLLTLLDNFVPVLPVDSVTYSYGGSCTEQTISGVVQSVCPSPGVPRSTSTAGLAWDEGAYQFPTPPALSVNASTGNHAISPYIYGTAYPDGNFTRLVHTPMNRFGGDGTTNYNWLVNTTNNTADNYFLSGQDVSIPSYNADYGIDFFKTYSPNITLLVTIPISGYIAKTSALNQCSWRHDIYGLSAYNSFAFVTAIPPSVGTGGGSHPPGIGATLTVTASGGAVTALAVPVPGSGSANWQVGDQFYVYEPSQNPNSESAIGQVTGVSGTAITTIAVVTGGFGYGTGTFTDGVTSDACGSGPNVPNTTLAYNYTTNTPAIQEAWVDHFNTKYGGTPNAVNWYQLDNEPSGWSAIHYDWVPNQPDYSVIVADGETYADAIYSQNPAAHILGPSDFGGFGWCGPEFSLTSDCIMLYWLKQFAAHDAANGHRELTTLDEHAGLGDVSHGGTPWAGGATYGGVQFDLDSNRSMWDPNFTFYYPQFFSPFVNSVWTYTQGTGTPSGYTANCTFTVNGGSHLAAGHVITTSPFAFTLDSWGGGYAVANNVATTNGTCGGSGLSVDITTLSPFNQAVQLWPRMQAYANKVYPGTGISNSEIDIQRYSDANWPSINGTSVIDTMLMADALGIYGQQNLSLVSNYYVISGSPVGAMAFAYELFQNYDGSYSQFGDTAITSTSTDPTLLSVYGATRTSDGKMTVICVNKTGAAYATTLSISGFTATSSALTETYSNANTGALVSGAATVTGGNSISYTFPAYSATEFVLTPSGASSPTVPGAPQMVKSQVAETQTASLRK